MEKLIEACSNKQQNQRCVVAVWCGVEERGEEVHAYKQRTFGPELLVLDGEHYICTSYRRYAPLDLGFHPVDSGPPGSIQVEEWW